jgi:hypothetical protein
MGEEINPMARLDFYMNVNQYKDSEKKPHYWSKVDLPIEFLKAVTTNAKDGDFTINAAAWVGENKKGNKYILVRLEDNEYQKANGKSVPKDSPAKEKEDSVADNTGSSGESQGWDSDDNLF